VFEFAMLSLMTFSACSLASIPESGMANDDMWFSPL